MDFVDRIQQSFVVEHGHMTDFERRLRVAIRKENGVRLSPLEAKQLARMLGVDDEVEPRRRRRVMEKREPIATHIRWMIRRDMADVLEIDSSVGMKWKESDFIRCLRQRNCIGMVAEHDEKAVGHMIYELVKSRLHVLNFGVSEKMQGQRIGTQMVDKLKDKLSQQRRNKITIEVDSSRCGLHMFLKRCGFFAISDDGEKYRFMFRHDKKRPRFRKSNRKTKWKDSIDDDDEPLFA